MNNTAMYITNLFRFYKTWKIAYTCACEPIGQTQYWRISFTCT